MQGNQGEHNPPSAMTSVKVLLPQPENKFAALARRCEVQGDQEGIPQPVVTPPASASSSSCGEGQTHLVLHLKDGTECRVPVQMSMPRTPTAEPGEGSCGGGTDSWQTCQPRRKPRPPRPSPPPDPKEAPKPPSHGYSAGQVAAQKRTESADKPEEQKVHESSPANVAAEEEIQEADTTVEQKSKPDVAGEPAVVDESDESDSEWVRLVLDGEEDAVEGNAMDHNNSSDSEICELLLSAVSVSDEGWLVIDEHRLLDIAAEYPEATNELLTQSIQEEASEEEAERRHKAPHSRGPSHSMMTRKKKHQQRKHRPSAPAEEAAPTCVHTSTNSSEEEEAESRPTEKGSAGTDHQSLVRTLAQERRELAAATCTSLAGTLALAGMGLQTTQLTVMLLQRLLVGERDIVPPVGSRTRKGDRQLHRKEPGARAHLASKHPRMHRRGK